jgi:hypothetical protein
LRLNSLKVQQPEPKIPDKFPTVNLKVTGDST